MNSSLSNNKHHFLALSLSNFSTPILILSASALSFMICDLRPNSFSRLVGIFAAHYRSFYLLLSPVPLAHVRTSLPGSRASFFLYRAHAVHRAAAYRGRLGLEDCLNPLGSLLCHDSCIQVRESEACDVVVVLPRSTSVVDVLPDGERGGCFARELPVDTTLPLE